MSNVLSSIIAVASHARAMIPTFRKDVATVFDGGATASARAGATASLAVKAIVILVLGYAAWQEWRMHIIYATETAAAQAEKATADAAARAMADRQGCTSPFRRHIPARCDRRPACHGRNGRPKVFAQVPRQPGTTRLEFC